MSTSLRQNTIRHPDNYEIHLDLLQAFEDELNPSDPEIHKMLRQVLGYGEISTVFELAEPAFAGFAFKRMSIFETAVELQEYLATYDEYHLLLKEKIGIKLPTHGYAACVNKSGRPIFYILQEKAGSETIGHNALSTLSVDEAIGLFAQVLHEFGKVYAFNQAQSKYEVAIDGQMSNWAIVQNDDATSHLIYIDTSTPIYRISGIDQLDPTLFLRSAPSFLRWILRLFFLEDVVNRYYDLRQVIVDLLGNLHKENLAYLIPTFIPIANDFLDTDLASLRPAHITENEVKAYYNEDRRIWALYANMRRLDRFLHNHLFRKQYPYILPGKGKR